MTIFEMLRAKLAPSEKIGLKDNEIKDLQTSFITDQFPLFASVPRSQHYQWQPVYETLKGKVWENRYSDTIELLFYAALSHRSEELSLERFYKVGLQLVKLYNSSHQHDAKVDIEHSLGFELEIGSLTKGYGEAEIRTVPFRSSSSAILFLQHAIQTIEFCNSGLNNQNEPNALAALHVNIGLTEKQADNYKSQYYNSDLVELFSLLASVGISYGRACQIFKELTPDNFDPESNTWDCGQSDIIFRLECRPFSIEDKHITDEYYIVNFGRFVGFILNEPEKTKSLLQIARKLKKDYSFFPFWEKNSYFAADEKIVPKHFKSEEHYEDYYTLSALELREAYFELVKGFIVYGSQSDHYEKWIGLIKEWAGIVTSESNQFTEKTLSL